LFHIYTPDFKRYESRKELGEFYAQKMKAEVPIEYIPLDRRDATDYSATLAEVKSQIRAKIREKFGIASSD
jgi:hypothetical protein